MTHAWRLQRDSWILNHTIQPAPLGVLHDEQNPMLLAYEKPEHLPLWFQSPGGRVNTLKAQMGKRVLWQSWRSWHMFQSLFPYMVDTENRGFQPEALPTCNCQQVPESSPKKNQWSVTNSSETSSLGSFQSAGVAFWNLQRSVTMLGRGRGWRREAVGDYGVSSTPKQILPLDCKPIKNTWRLRHLTFLKEFKCVMYSHQRWDPLTWLSQGLWGG